MPAHAVAGHLVVILAPLVAILALVYTGRPGARRALRWPLVVGGAVAFAVAVWAGDAGGALLEQLEQAASTSGEPLPAAVRTHAKGSDALVVALFALGGAVLAVAWGPLRPGRAVTTPGRVAAVVVAVAGLAVLVTTGTVLVESMRAVWSTQDLWSA